jgi:hypothetical protein
LRQHQTPKHDTRIDKDNERERKTKRDNEFDVVTMLKLNPELNTSSE